MHQIRLVSAEAAPGLVPSARPSPEATPNNHLLYAIQWFFFAAAAAVIYVLALRKRQKQ
jgi:cytochrome oxidase assembly protein ShyY1